MIIAREKRKTNIAEFILYMWQIEDVVRAAKFNMEKIDQIIVQKYQQPPEVIDEIKEWYNSLILVMKQEGIEQKGHLNFVQNIISDLDHLHQRLLRNPDEKKYQAIYKVAKPNIDLLISKSLETATNDIEASLTGMYGYLLMKLRNREIFKETQDAMTTISNMLALLSKKFKDIEEGK